MIPALYSPIAKSSTLRASKIVPKPIVIACVGSWLSRTDCVAFGQAIRQAATALGRRVAFVASADLAHTHDKDGPFGFDAAAGYRHGKW